MRLRTLMRVVETRVSVRCPGAEVRILLYRSAEACGVRPATRARCTRPSWQARSSCPVYRSGREKCDQGTSIVPGRVDLRATSHVQIVRMRI